MKKSTLRQNYIYNVIYQIFAMIVILITTPYVSRVLGSELIGIYSYTYSIVSYFILIGSLGISLYGQREIAYCQDNESKRSQVFWEIFILKAILTVLSGIVFYFIFCINGSYALYYKILMLELIANGLDIIWLFQGLEDFKKVVIRNIIVKALVVLSILMFVKTTDDLWKYVLLYSLSNLLGNMSLWISLPKYVSIIKFNELHVWKHLKPTLVLFLPQIAIQIYTSLDKTMIGAITGNMSSVGIYQKTQEIARLGLTIVTAFGTVVFPRMANCFVKKDDKGMRDCLNEGFVFLWLIALPVMFGLMAISNNLIPWFLGNDFLPSIKLLVLFSWIVIIIGLNNVIGMQYLIATKQQKFFSIAVTVGAIVNVIFNMILIHYYDYTGAVIATLIAETTILIIEFYHMRFVIKDSLSLETLFKCLISSIIMAIAIYCFGKDMNPTISTTFIQVVVGIVIYFTLLILLKEKNIIDNIYKVFGKLRRNINE